jgi:rhodanese-related sulfurtransferase
MTILRTLLVAAGIALFASTARADTKSEGFGELTTDQVQALISSKGADIFDNNTPDEWKSGHVPTAKWVDFKDVKASDLPKDKGRKLVFYCHNTH